MQRSEDRCDKRRFRRFNHSTCKTVLNLLEAVYLRLRKIVVERVTVVKFRVDNRGSDGTGCFRIEVRTDTAELSDMRIAGLRKFLFCQTCSSVLTCLDAAHSRPLPPSTVQALL